MGRKRSKHKHIPLRTCVACREASPKRELIRLVLLAEGEVVVDETGKRNGRGAYLCRKRSCWERALKRGILDRALRTHLSAESKARLQHYAASLPEYETDSDTLVTPEVGAEGRPSPQGSG